jgi:hypothetical protein
LTIGEGFCSNNCFLDGRSLVVVEEEDSDSSLDLSGEGRLLLKFNIGLGNQSSQ